MNDRLVTFVVGPTAAGKSALALALAREFGGSILNCDSLQCCRRLDVGSAKPTAAERALVPHYLFDVIEPGQALTAGDFRRLALDRLAHATARGPVFAVGGSGFYIRALENGMFDVPRPSARVAERVRARAASVGPAELHDALAALDPEYAGRLNPNDVYRVCRALIMIEDAGETVTSLRRRFKPEPFPYRRLKLGLDSKTLPARIEARARGMIADGLVEETRALVDEGFGDWPALASVGYRETVAHLGGAVTAAELPELIALKTRQLAKKQRTWFRRDPTIHWLDEARAFAEARTLVGAHLDPSRAPS